MPYSLQALNAAALTLLCTCPVAANGRLAPQIVLFPLLQA